MKVIDLLNKIANGEDIPKKIEYNDKIWRLASNRTYFIGSDYGYDFWLEHGDDKFEDEPITLNDEVKILDDEDEEKEEKKITPTDFENLGYALGSIQKCINKGYDKAIEENEKIEPLKIEQDTPSSNFYIRNEYGTKCGLTKHSKMIAEKVNELVREINKMKKD